MGKGLAGCKMANEVGFRGPEVRDMEDKEGRENADGERNDSYEMKLVGSRTDVSPVYLGLFVFLFECHILNELLYICLYLGLSLFTGGA
jgi:hypothetical protein